MKSKSKTVKDCKDYSIGFCARTCWMAKCENVGCDIKEGLK